MAGMEIALQRAVYDALTSSGQATLVLDFVDGVYQVGSATRQQAADELAARIVAVYDFVPPVSTSGAEGFPFVTIGEDNLTAWDTDTSTGGDVSFVVHTWSRAKGRTEVKEIQGLIYTILNRATLCTDGYSFVSCDLLTSDCLLDTDGLTVHGTQTFRALFNTAT